MSIYVPPTTTMDKGMNTMLENVLLLFLIIRANSNSCYTLTIY